MVCKEMQLNKTESHACKSETGDNKCSKWLRFIKLWQDTSCEGQLMSTLLVTN